MCSSFWDKPWQARAFGNGSGGWKVTAVNGGVGGGWQQAMTDTDKTIGI